jgi:hypothetical protein
LNCATVMSAGIRYMVNLSQSVVRESERGRRRRAKEDAVGGALTPFARSRMR